MVKDLRIESLLGFLAVYTAVIAWSRNLFVGQELAPPLFWPAAGILFAAFMLAPRSQWWLLAGLAFLANLIGNQLSDVVSDPRRYLILPARMAVMIFGILFLNRLSRQHSEESPERALFFVLIGGLLIPAVSGLVSAGWIAIQEHLSFRDSFRAHFVGSSLGILTIAPFLLSLRQMLHERRHFDLKSALLNAAILLGVAGFCVHVFLLDFLPRTIHFELLAMPLVISISLRGNAALSSSSNLMIAGFAFHRVLQDKAFLFSTNNPTNDLHNVQFFVAITTLTHLLLTASAKRRMDTTRTLSEKTEELSRVNNELEKARREALAASEAKSYFLANMSHEIRSPLSAMIGYAELITRHDETQADKVKYGEIISKNGHHLLEILNQILDLSKIEAGQIEIEKEDCSLRNIIEDVYELLKPRALKKNLNFHVKWQSYIPDQVLADPLRLKQILINGIGNAIKFTEAGFVEIRLWAELEDQKVCKLFCEIEDSGIGLEKEEQEKLFNAFAQANRSISKRYGGTGLGLKLSRRLARLMGGDYRLKKSIKGQGSVFVLELPLLIITPPAYAKKSNSIAINKVDSESGRLQGLRILLVDDAPDNRFLISRLLQMSGAHVESAENGKKALDIFERSEFDIVLMDIEMPEMDGLEATRRLRARLYQGPILALTGRAMPEEIEECLEAGFNGHLIKPIHRNTLFESIEQWTRFHSKIKIISDRPTTHHNQAL